jgi:hypothetical protein
VGRAIPLKKVGFQRKKGTMAHLRRIHSKPKSHAKLREEISRGAEK